MTGFGRTGTMFACEQAGDRAGLPVPFEGHHRRLPAAFLRARHRRRLRCVLRRRRRRAASCIRIRTPATPLACRAALAVLDIFRDDDVIARNRDTAARWRRLAEPLAAHPRVRALPAMWNDPRVRGRRERTRRFRALVRGGGACARAGPAAADREHGVFHAALHRRRTTSSRCSSSARSRSSMSADTRLM